MILQLNDKDSSIIVIKNIGCVAKGYNCITTNIGIFRYAEERSRDIDYGRIVNALAQDTIPKPVPVMDNITCHKTQFPVVDAVGKVVDPHPPKKPYKFDN